MVAVIAQFPGWGSEPALHAAADAGDFASLPAALAARFAVTAAPERRSLSVPAPHVAEDLAAVTSAVQAAGVSVEQIALRRAG